MTFAELVDRIQSEIDHSGVTDDVAKDAIRSAIRSYRNKRLYFNEAYSTTDTVQGTQRVALPDDCIEVDSLNITVDGFKYELDRETLSWIEDSHGSGYEGQPSHYAIHRKEINLYPIPDAEYTLSMRYLKQLAELSADTDENDWITDGQDLIRLKAKSEIYGNFLKSYDEANYCGSLAAMELEILLSQSNKYLSSGRLRAHCI